MHGDLIATDLDLITLVQRCAAEDANAIKRRHAGAQVNDAWRLICKAINCSCDIGNVVDGQRQRGALGRVANADSALEKLVLVDRMRQRYVERQPRQSWIGYRRAR